MSRLDRLARSTLHLCQIADLLNRKQVALHVLDQNLNTSNATGRLLFNMLSAIAEFETEIRSKRQLDGIHKAKEVGVRFGRKQILSAPQINELHLRRGYSRDTRKLGHVVKLCYADVCKCLILRCSTPVRARHSPRKHPLKQPFMGKFERLNRVKS